MRIPLGDADIGYVHKSPYPHWIKNVKHSTGYFVLNDIYEGKAGYEKMTFEEFKLKYPKPGRYVWLRYRENPYG